MLVLYLKYDFYSLVFVFEGENLLRTILLLLLFKPYIGSVTGTSSDYWLIMAYFFFKPSELGLSIKLFSLISALMKLKFSSFIIAIFWFWSWWVIYICYSLITGLITGRFSFSKVIDFALSSGIVIYLFFCIYKSY